MLGAESGFYEGGLNRHVRAFVQAIVRLKEKILLITVLSGNVERQCYKH